jgi:DGQHR domain-containing protein
MKKNKKRKIPTEEQIQKRQQRSFSTKIRNIFTGSGFTYIATNGHEMKVGLRKVEIDSLFVYENIWLLCEDTIKTSHIREHIRTKNEAFNEIKANLSDYINGLVNIFPDKIDLLTEYDVSRIKIFNLYISREDIDLTDDEYNLYNNLIFVHTKTFEYFQWIVKCIKHSAKSEIFRYLGISNSDIGLPSSSDSDSKNIKAPIIYPKEFTGLKNGVRVVSFMMCADDLLNTCYVLRKDNWQESIWLYQRLIDKSKIKSIREFIAKNGEAFYNNIIVALPDNAYFINAADKRVNITEIGELDNDCKLVLSKNMNSICVIDGQHRIFAHYESGIDSLQERRIAKLRSQLHLLVTGLVFPAEMKNEDRIRIQSEIFLDINSNAKPVPPNVLLQIKRLINPIADESLAQFVIEKLNKHGIFKNQLQVSSLETGKIKTASIVRFALRYLVTLTPAENKKSLYEYWLHDNDALKANDDKAINGYISFCADALIKYFSAIIKHFKNDWEDDNSKLKSVISINGFIIAFTRQLHKNGLQDFNYYDKKFANWTIDFSKEGFEYTSSQYHKFSDQILSEVFGFSDEEIEIVETK